MWIFKGGKPSDEKSNLTIPESVQYLNVPESENLEGSDTYVTPADVNVAKFMIKQRYHITS